MLAVFVNMTKIPVESEKRKPVRFFTLFKTMVCLDYEVDFT